MAIKRFADISRIDKIFSVLVILLPFLYQYKGIGSTLSFGEAILLPVIAIIFINNFNLNMKKVDSRLVGFYIITIFCAIINASFIYFNVSTAATVLLRLFYYAILIWIAKEHFHLEYVKNLYYFAVFGFSVYLIIQYLYHNITNDYLPIYLKYEWQFPAEARVRDLSRLYRWEFRPSSLFLEPSYYSLFSMPSVVMLLYERKSTRKKMITLFTIIIGLVLSGAASGVVGLAVIFTIFLFKKAEGKSASLLFRILIIVVAIGIVSLYVVNNENSNAVDRLVTGGSFNQRITRGIIIYNKLPFFHKIFGVGINNLEPFMLYNHITTRYDENSLDYGCTIVQTMNFSGAVGLLSLIYYLAGLRGKVYQNIRKAFDAESSFSRSIVTPMYWLLVFILSYEGIMFTYRFAFLVIILQALSSPKATNKKEVENFENSLHRYSVRRSPHNLSF